MKFNAFFITLLGVNFVGISIGYIIGYFIQKFDSKIRPSTCLDTNGLCKTLKEFKKI